MHNRNEQLGHQALPARGQRDAGRLHTRQAAYDLGSSSPRVWLSAANPRELELELIQPHMTQKPVLRVEVGARVLRNPAGREGGVRHVLSRAAAGGAYKRARRDVVGRARLHVL